MQCFTCCETIDSTYNTTPYCQVCIYRMVQDVLNLEQVALWHMFECSTCSFIVSLFIGNGD